MTQETEYPRSQDGNWEPVGKMNHFILLNAIPTSKELYYRIRADRIDWIAERVDDKGKVNTVVCAGGRELCVTEPVEIVLRFIEDPLATCLHRVEYKGVDHFALSEKYGSEKGHEIYKKIMRLP